MSPQRKQMRRNHQKRMAARRAIPKLLRKLAEAFAEVYKPFTVVIYRRVRWRRGTSFPVNQRRRRGR